MLDISVVIPVKNSEAYLSECLSSLENQTIEKSKYEIIVVDNCSSDKSREIAGTFDVKVITSLASNAAGVRNDGASVTKSKVIAFLDSDCIAPKDWLENILKLLKSDEKLGLVGGAYLANPKGTWVEKSWSPPGGKTEKYVNSLPGGNMAFSYDAWASVGGFNTELTSAEDDDISRRCIRSGFKILASPRLAVTHLGNAKDITDFYIKIARHAKTQIKAHGFFGDKAIILTWVYLISILSITIGISFSNVQILTFSIIAYLACTFSFATKRANSSLKFIFSSQFIQLIILTNLFFLARGVGLLKESKNIVKAKHQKNKLKSTPQ